MEAKPTEEHTCSKRKDRTRNIAVYCNNCYVQHLKDGRGDENPVIVMAIHIAFRELTTRIVFPVKESTNTLPSS
jgi:hypothetical protein